MLRLTDVAADQLQDLPEPYRGYGARRRLEVVAGRLCVAKCLAELGRQVSKFIQHRADGVPDWPPGLVGSISHSRDVAFAVVALSEECRSVGVDVQAIVTPSRFERLCARVLTPVELTLFPKVTPEIVAQVFSAKEAIFKCLYPLVGKKFYFQDAAVTEFGDHGSFKFELRSELSDEFHVGWQGEGSWKWLDDQQVVTLVQLLS